MWWPNKKPMTAMAILSGDEGVAENGLAREGGDDFADDTIAGKIMM